MWGRRSRPLRMNCTLKTHNYRFYVYTTRIAHSNTTSSAHSPLGVPQKTYTTGLRSNLVPQRRVYSPCGSPWFKANFTLIGRWKSPPWRRVQFQGHWSCGRVADGRTGGWMEQRFLFLVVKKGFLSLFFSKNMCTKLGEGFKFFFQHNWGNIRAFSKRKPLFQVAYFFQDFYGDLFEKFQISP